ncbi:mitochondrial import receptor subunit TOM40 homolog 1-like [Liolophura sinensis]|uniref:mitochondrial import receptor subunit TOM40 homolog 1-like n=1 Tax=Liolophura sinensis TaxID=3198878 RepID=UPI003158E82F
MGNRMNVLAAGPGGVPSPSLVPPPPQPVPPSPPSPPKPGDSPTSVLAEPSKFADNPGTFEDLHKKCKDVFPQVFEGGKLIISKALSSHFQISHTLSMSTFQPSGYRFGATYVGSKQFSPQEGFPILVGDLDPSGNLNANMVHQFTENIRSKFVTQIQDGKWMVSQLTTDYKGTDFTGSLTIGNPDIVKESGILVAHYLQSVRPNLALGAELLYQYGQQIPGGELAVFSLAGRLSGDDWQFSTNISPSVGGLHACYYHKINNEMQVGVELETSLRMQESLATVGYQIDLPSANLVFRGQVDTNWCISAMLEKKLQPLPFTLALSAYANQVKSQFRFGIGLIVG